MLFKNSIEIVSGLDSKTNGATTTAKTGTEELMLMITRKYEDNLKELQGEITLYQECLKNLRGCIADLAEQQIR